MESTLAGARDSARGMISHTSAGLFRRWYVAFICVSLILLGSHVSPSQADSAPYFETYCSALSNLTDLREHSVSSKVIRFDVSGSVTHHILTWANVFLMETMGYTVELNDPISTVTSETSPTLVMERIVNGTADINVNVWPFGTEDQQVPGTRVIRNEFMTSVGLYAPAYLEASNPEITYWRSLMDNDTVSLLSPLSNFVADPDFGEVITTDACRAAPSTCGAILTTHTFINGDHMQSLIDEFDLKLALVPLGNRFTTEVAALESSAIPYIAMFVAPAPCASTNDFRQILFPPSSFECPLTYAATGIGCGSLPFITHKIISSDLVSPSNAQLIHLISQMSVTHTDVTRIVQDYAALYGMAYDSEGVKEYGCRLLTDVVGFDMLTMATKLAWAQYVDTSSDDSSSVATAIAVSIVFTVGLLIILFLCIHRSKSNNNSVATLNQVREVLQMDSRRFMKTTDGNEAESPTGQLNRQGTTLSSAGATIDGVYESPTGHLTKLLERLERIQDAHLQHAQVFKDKGLLETSVDCLTYVVCCHSNMDSSLQDQLVEREKDIMAEIAVSLEKIGHSSASGQVDENILDKHDTDTQAWVLNELAVNQKTAKAHDKSRRRSLMRGASRRQNVHRALLPSMLNSTSNETINTEASFDMNGATGPSLLSCMKAAPVRWPVDWSSFLHNDRADEAFVDKITYRWILKLSDTFRAMRPTFITGRGLSDEELKVKGIYKCFDLGALCNSRIPVSPEKTVSLRFTSKSWDFDVFELSDACGGDPVPLLGMILLQHHNLIEELNINPLIIRNCLLAIGQGYHVNNPFHNATHAADVAQSVCFMVQNTVVGANLTTLEKFCLIMAALMHDYDHPGVNNTFLTETGHPLAMRYNDSSVLENHHVSSILSLLSQNSLTDIFSWMDPDDRVAARSLIVQLVLATDLGKNFGIVADYKKKFSSRTSTARSFGSKRGSLASARSYRSSKDSTGPRSNDYIVSVRSSAEEAAAFNNAVYLSSADFQKSEDRMLILKMVLKCGDLGHPAKPWRLHAKWTELVSEEFFQQGDKEKKLGVKVGPFMDRNKIKEVPKQQVGFFNFLVLPMWDAFLKSFPPKVLRECRSALESNSMSWVQIADQKAELPGWIHESSNEGSAGMS